MADNYTTNSGSGGNTYASDDISGVHYPRVKLAIGADGSAADVSSANPIPISDNSTTLSVDDGAGSLTVDNAALSVTGGGVEASALRVTLASDSTGVVSVDDNGGSLTVDGTVAVSGTVAVTDNSGSLTVDNAALSVTGGGVESTALRVTLASDSTGLVSVDDNGGSLTVDGTVTANVATATTGGATIYRTIDLDESEEEVKATAGTVYGMWVSNLATSTRFVKFYNATAANVTVGLTTPVITIAVPGNSTDDVSGSFGGPSAGIDFDTAICIAATTGVADADTGAPSANDVLCNVFYK